MSLLLHLYPGMSDLAQSGSDWYLIEAHTLGETLLTLGKNLPPCALIPVAGCIEVSYVVLSTRTNRRTPEMTVMQD